MLKSTLVLYAATLSVLVAMDLTWLGAIARDFYRSRLGDLLEFHAAPAVLFYLIYAAAILIFVSGGTVERWQTVVMYGALFGFVAYATYDLTNLATLKGWPLSLALADIAWGSFTTAVSATAGWWVTRHFFPS